MPAPGGPAAAQPVRVLLVTGHPAIAEQVSRLCAAVGVEVAVAPDVDTAGALWGHAGLVVLDEEAAARGAPVRRPAVVLVAADTGGGSGEQRCWRLAVEVGAEAVARLPADEGWLLERLAEAADGHGRSGRVLGALGGRGGAGASTLAAGLATAAVDAGLDVVLLDADPAGGGLDLLVGAEHEPGLRWPDLTGARGVLRRSTLRDGLPRAGGIRVLSCGREGQPLPAAAMEAVLESARRGHELVVVDLPRQEDPATSAALWRVDTMLVVVPAEVRAAAAAAGLVRRISPLVGDVRLVVRGPAPGGLSADVVADAVGLPVGYRWAHEPAVAQDADRGRPPGLGRGATARLCRRVLADLLAEGTVGYAAPAVGAGTR